MRNDGLTRVNFHDRQFLRPQDLVAEQLYHLIGHRRHAIGSHSWGIVTGLEVTVDEGNVYVEPGMAVDGYGRDLVAGQRLVVRTETFDEKVTDKLHVWLIFGEEGAEGAPPGFTCVEPNGNGRSPNGGAAIPPYRWREQPIVVLTDGRAGVDPRGAPDGVLDIDVPFEPQRAFPTGDDAWGVFLGTVQREGPRQAPTYLVTTDGRPYVGLVGWQVMHPAGDARIELGPEPGGPPDRRFAVFIAEEGANADPRLEIEQVAPPVPAVPGDVLETTLTVRGHARVAGNVTVEQGSVGFEGAKPGDTTQRSWQIYRKGRSPNVAQDTDELRIEMGATQPAGQNRVAIGKWNAEDKKFEPCLTVTDQCLVTVHGNLVVEGAMPALQGVTPPKTDPAAKAALAAIRSNAAANVLFGIQAAEPADEQVDAVLLRALDDRADIEALARRLADRSPDRADLLIDALRIARERQGEQPAGPK